MQLLGKPREVYKRAGISFAVIVGELLTTLNALKMKS